MSDIVDIIHPETLRELQGAGLSVIHLVMGIIQKPARNAHHIEHIHLELERMEGLLHEAGLEGDDESPEGIAVAAEPMSFSDMAFATALTGIQELAQDLFGQQEMID